MSKEERDKELKAHMNNLEKKYYYQQVDPIISKFGSEDVSTQIMNLKKYVQ